MNTRKTCGFEARIWRDCPSLVGGRPAKSVVERPRGFKSHIPRLHPHPPRLAEFGIWLLQNKGNRETTIVRKLKFFKKLSGPQKT